MGLLVAVAIILISPSIRLGWRWRIAFVLMGLVAASWVVQSEAFQERFFVGRYEGTLTDILLLRGNVNTAGRAENWPRVIEACSGSSWLGKGIGATEQVTLEATAGATIHPHNEFIRWYCDVGVVGSLAFWGFFAIFGVWGLRQWIAGGNEWGAPSLQVVVALILFSLTDNVTIYSSTFMAPALLLLGSAAAARQLERVSHS